MRSTSMSVGAIIVVSWFFAQAAAFGLTLEESIDVERVMANQNEIKRVQGEIGYVASHLVPGAKGVDITIEEAVADDVVITLRLSAEKLEQAQGQRILQTAKRYVRLRLEGHSKQFALYLVLHGAESWPEELQKIIVPNAGLNEMIAFPWIYREARGTLAFPTQRETEKNAILYVVDGDLAWSYLIPKKPGTNVEDIIKFRFDAIEFSPAASETIRKVFDELKEEGRVPSLQQTPGAAWWFEFKERLKQRTGLRWRTPAELNPGVQFD